VFSVESFGWEPPTRSMAVRVFEAGQTFSEVDLNSQREILEARRAFNAGQYNRSIMHLLHAAEVDSGTGPPEEAERISALFGYDPVKAYAPPSTVPELAGLPADVQDAVAKLLVRLAAGGVIPTGGGSYTQPTGTVAVDGRVRVQPPVTKPTSGWGK
jgi:hypothetical protein